jgi:RNA polymerase sigma-70 factor (ECF subfamily)
MIAAQSPWPELQKKLRPFIARRVNESADVDDILQEVFLRMQRGLGGLREEERFGPWLYQVARSAIVDHHRAAAKRNTNEVPEEDLAVGPPAENPEHDNAACDLANAVAPFVALLPSPYREALTLVELEGLTQREAADMMGISVSGMKSRVQRGRALLREALEACCRISTDARGKVIECTPRPDGRLPRGCVEATERGEKERCSP